MGLHRQNWSPGWQKSQDLRLFILEVTSCDFKTRCLSFTSYEDPFTLVGECDFVMANPPFNVDMVDAKRAEAATIAESVAAFKAGYDALTDAMAAYLEQIAGTDREAAVPPAKAKKFSGGSARPPTKSGGTPAPAATDREAAVPPEDAQARRKQPAHLPNVERFNQPAILFLTVCTKSRRPILACERVHGVLVRAWPEARQYRVGRYMVMPDHVHLFCSPAVHEPENVKRWAAYWKGLVSIELKDLQPLWQRDCWDTQLRDASHYEETWQYVVQNPVRRGLVARAKDWPYQGCLNELRW